MNKEQRAPYLFLANFPDDGYGLCSWCKFAEWSGDCCDSCLECKHPLGAINDGSVGYFGEDHPTQVWGFGCDCWGFRPKKGVTLQEIGLVASIRAQGYMARLNKRGEWKAIIPSKADREAMLI